jgi:hypothetical protein
MTSYAGDGERNDMDAEKCMKACEGLPDGALDGGWTAVGMSAYAKKLEDAIALAYGYLWHVNNEPMAPVPMYSPEKAAYEARKVLRDLMTHEQRGEAINKVQGLLGHNDGVRALFEEYTNA